MTIREDQYELRWQRGLDRLHAHVAAQGSAAVPTHTVEHGFALGRWTATQRHCYWAGRLSPEQVEALVALPGWDWGHTREHQWAQGMAHLHRYADAHGTTAVAQHTVVDGYPLGAWVARRRSNHHTGILSPARVAALEQLPGWVWAHAEDTWLPGRRVLTSYLVTYGTALVPAAGVHQGFPLGSWVATRRAQYRRGALAPARVASLQALPGWVWEVRVSRWEQGLGLLTAYAARTGRPDPPQSHIADLADDAFPLGSWVSSRRRDYRNGVLSAGRVAALEAIPGWQWHPSDATWQHRYTLAQREVAERGSIAHLGPHDVIEGVKLGRWVSTQRARHSAGRLAPDRVAALHALPGWDRAR